VRGPRAAGRLSSPADVGDDPDARFTLANERTFLAWIRTALALMVTGLAVAEFFDSRSQGTRLAIALPLIALAAVVALNAFGAWAAKERALRVGESLPTSALPRLIGMSIGVIAVVAGVLTVVDP